MASLENGAAAGYWQRDMWHGGKIEARFPKPAKQP